MTLIKYQHPALECEENDDKNFIMVPGKNIVCSKCEGFGQHDRRDIDTSKLIDSMIEDGDYDGIEAYHNGSYDQICTNCKGNKVVLEPDWESLPEWAKKAITSWEQSERESKEYERQEKAMGA